MPKALPPANKTTLDNFKCSLPEPQPYKVIDQGELWTCSDCGEALKCANDWCGPCARAWSDAHLAWLNVCNDEFKGWYAKHKAELETKLFGSGVHLSEGGELTTEPIIKDRRRYFKSTIQPYRDGEPSREFMEAFPDKAKKTFSEQERRSARYVWKDVPGWANREKSE